MTNSCRAFAVVLAALVLAACERRDPTAARGPLSRERPSIDTRPRAHPTDSTADPEDLFAVTLQPGDLMTSVRGTPPTVLLGTESLTEHMRELLSSAVQLVTWPERAPTSCSFSFSDALETHGSEWSMMEFDPGCVAEDRWYALVIDVAEIPQAQVTDEALVLEDTLFASRFHPGSWPTVRRVSVSAGDPDAPATVNLRLDMSERVRSPHSADDAVRVTVRGRPVRCIALEPEVLADEYGSHVLNMSCAHDLVHDAFEVRVDPGVSAIDGGRIRSPVFDGLPALRFGSSSERARRTMVPQPEEL